jgi:hypothetical protein
MYDAVTQQRIDDFRRKCADGSITLEEMKEAVLLVRGGRQAAAEAASASKRTSTKKPTRSADELLAGLGDL